jgi:hypothetical protein
MCFEDINDLCWVILESNLSSLEASSSFSRVWEDDREWG